MIKDEREVLEEVLKDPPEKSKGVPVVTKPTSEDDRLSNNNPWLTSPDTGWIDQLYMQLYPLTGTPRHRYTFTAIIVNLSKNKEVMEIQLHRSKYKNTYRPPEFLPSKVSEICDKLAKKGYITLERGYKLQGKEGVPTTIEPTEALLSLIPTDMTFRIQKEGLVIPWGFTPNDFPPYALEVRELLHEYNKTVEPENHLYATHKDGFELNGRFTGSKVIRMSKVDRKLIEIDGESTVELDVSNCLPFILSASELEEELPGDVYEIHGIPRDLVKIAFVVAMNTKSREKARKAIQSRINKNHRGLSHRADFILDQVEAANPDLVEFFYKCLGTRLMFKESQCMAKFMRRMLDLGIKFYPIYDSVRVPESKREIVREELKRAFTFNGVEPTLHERQQEKEKAAKKLCESLSNGQFLLSDMTGGRLSLERAIDMAYINKLGDQREVKLMKEFRSTSC